MVSKCGHPDHWWDCKHCRMIYTTPTGWYIMLQAFSTLYLMPICCALIGHAKGETHIYAIKNGKIVDGCPRCWRERT